MCQSHHRSCLCGQETCEIFFGQNLLGPSTVSGVYCPSCRQASTAPAKDRIEDNGWILELEAEALRAAAPQMALDPETITADQVFDGEYVTWVGFTPIDNRERTREREDLAARWGSDRRAHFEAMKRWAMEREARLADLGWRKARRSRA